MATNADNSVITVVPSGGPPRRSIGGTIQQQQVSPVHVEDEGPTLSKDDLNRVHEELEKLNIATEVINKLEVQLDEGRSRFGDIQSAWATRLEDLSKKHGSCIAKSRPYYEARLNARKVQEKAQQAAIRFERANSMHQVSVCARIQA
jgi:hypothetical protein